MKVKKTDEWKSWCHFLPTRDNVPPATLWPLPMLNPLTMEWIIYHPHSTIYMSIPNKEYLEHLEIITKGQKRKDSHIE